MIKQTFKWLRDGKRQFGTRNKIMNKLSTVALVPIVIALMLFVLPSSLNLVQQANAADTVSDSFQSSADEKQASFFTAVTSNTFNDHWNTPLPCYGPCIMANVSRNQVNLGESVTVTGQICPPANNITVRVTFTRPDYTWIDQYVIADNVTGGFNVTQKLDMAGFWNIFPIYGHISDRLYTNVTDPNIDPLAPTPTPPKLPGYRPNYTIVSVAIAAASVAIVAATVGTRKKTRKISSLRLFVQIGIIFLLFFGVFIDHQNIPVPAEQIAPHEFLLGTNSMSIMPDGLPIPVFGCYFPCGRTFTCPLWQIQTYIYPFWNAGRGFGVNYDASGLERLAIVFVIVIIAAVLLGRFWCGWICPFGLYMDVMTRLRKALKIKHRSFSPAFNEKFHQLSYIILALIIIISVLFASQAIAGTQLISGTQQGGFVYTYFNAPFCQVCPMKPLCLLLETSVGLMRPEWIVGGTSRSVLPAWPVFDFAKPRHSCNCYGGSIFLQTLMVQNLPPRRINCVIQQVPTIQVDFRSTHRKSWREMHQMWCLQTSLPNPSHPSLRRKKWRRDNITVLAVSAVR